jgi:anti-sigma factor RsiW
VTVAASSPAHQFFVVFGAALTGFGLLFVLVGLVIRKASRGFRGAARTQGTIVALDPRVPGTIRAPGGKFGFGGWQGSDEMVYMPTVEFTTADGTQVKATSNVGTNPRPGRVGDTVTVLYDPRNPQKVRVQSGKSTVTCMEAAFMVFGGAVAALGIVILVAAH